MGLLKEEIELGAQEAELEVKLQLNQFPKWKRWTLVICLIAVIPGYLVAKNTSYAYWQKKYAPLILTAKDTTGKAGSPEVGEVNFVDNGNKTFSAVFTLTNPNLDLSAHDVPLEVDFYNSAGEMVGTPFTSTVYFLPGSTQYIVITRLPTQDVSRVNVNIPPDIHWQRRLFLPTVELTANTPSLNFITSPVASVLTGGVRNDSAYDVGAVRIIFLLYNAKNQIIGVSQRDEFNIAHNAKRDYVQTWPGVFFPLGTTVKVIVQTNTLDPNNLKVPQSPKGSASDLSRPETQPH